jgi:long-chain acyl-CoA synthetase
MKSDDALLLAWEKTLARGRERPAIFGTNGKVLRAFGEIETRAQELESKIDIFERGSRIAIQIGNHADWPSIFIACLRRGLIVLPLEQSMNEKQRDAALKICDVAGVVAAGVSAGSDIQVLPLGTAAATTRWEDPPSLLKLTSGTTATPRAIRFRGEQLLADCDQICATMGISDADLNFGVIPISHSYGFSNLLTPLIARAVPIVLSHDRTPRAVLVDLARTNATVFPGMPIFYQAFCEMENVRAGLAVEELPKLRLCISAGAPLSTSVAKKFQERFGLAIHSFYGASECGGICYDREPKNEIDGFVGEPMKDVDLEIVDPTDEASQVRVSSAAVGDGYFPEPDPEKLGNGIFLPDDLLMRYDSGFKIVGRISDLINVAGKKLNPAVIEAVLLRFPGVRQAVAFGRESALRNEEIAACVATDVDPSETDLIEFCRRELTAWQVPKRIFIIDAIPVNERGKISRRKLARRFVL